MSVDQKVKRNLQLDVLRGIAILVVIGNHLNIPLPPGAWGSFADFWYHQGVLGVDLFFVLSGFLIGGLLLSEHTRHGEVDFSRFFIRRGLKIYPLYVVFLAYVILRPALAAINGGSPLDVIAAQWSRYWPNFLFLHTYIGSNPAGHTWSLAVEEHFYLLLPLVLLCLVRVDRIRWILPLTAAAIPLFIGIRWLSVTFGDPYVAKMAASHLRLDALLFGVGIRAIAEYHPQIFERLGSLRFALVCLGVLLWLPSAYRDSLGNIYRIFGLTTTMFGSACFLVAALHTTGKDFGFLRNYVRPTAQLLGIVGFYSYSIYLWHVTFIRVGERMVEKHLPSLNGSLSAAGWATTVLIVSCAAIVCGMIISRLVEWPVVGLRDKWFPPRARVLPAEQSKQLSVPEGEGSPTRKHESAFVC